MGGRGGAVVIRLALKTLKARKGGFFGAFVALFLAATVVSAAGILLESGVRASSSPERYAAADVVVGGKQSFDAPADPENPDGGTGESTPLTERVRLDSGVLDKVRAVPGVREAVADVSFPATVIVDGKPLDGPASWGHGWDSAKLAPFTLGSGHEPVRSDEVVLDNALAGKANAHVGDRITVSVRGIPRTVTVSGIANSERPLVKQSAVFFGQQAALGLAGRSGTVDAIGVLARPGTDAEALASSIQGSLGEKDFVALTGEQRGRIEFLDGGNGAFYLVSLSGSFGGVGLAVVLFVVASTFVLSVQQRHREIALLRAVGATPKQVRRMIAAEALLISLPGALIGSLLGIGLASLLRSLFVDHGMIPDSLQLRVGWLPVLVAVCSTVLVALLATFVAGRRAGKTAPTEALAEASADRRILRWPRLVLGLAFAAISVVVMGISTGVTGDGAAGVSLGVLFSLLLTLALLAPVLVRIASGLLGALVRMFSGSSGYLAVANSRSNTRRVSSAVIPMMLAVGFACTEIFLPASALQAAADQAAEGSRADHVITGQLSPDVVREVRAVPGVQSATAVVRTKILTGTTAEPDMSAVPAQAVDATDLGSTVDLGLRAGNLADLRGDSIALSQTEATALGWNVGSDMPIRLADGTAKTVKVVAIYSRGLGYGDVTVPLDMLRGHTTSGLVDQVLVKGGSADALAALGSRHPGLSVVDPQAALVARDEDQRANQWGAFLVTFVIVLYTGIAMINTLAMTTTERRREFALLRLVGATRDQVLRMARWESVMLIVTAIALGTGIAIATLVPYSMGRTETSFPYWPPLGYAAIVLVTVCLGWLAVILPAKHVLRDRPVDAIGSRE
ncbi:FtsX-like permease family protein [Pseudonocardiaceae bacterium YIM PH 21723]|nr:FtsX-like permease family protein [Pseudonocardiaceae bacterium YIM PH 21723]